jgi:hypothetical protein
MQNARKLHLEIFDSFLHAVAESLALGLRFCVDNFGNLGFVTLPNIIGVSVCDCVLSSGNGAQYRQGGRKKKNS